MRGITNGSFLDEPFSIPSSVEDRLTALRTTLEDSGFTNHIYSSNRGTRIVFEPGQLKDDDLRENLRRLLPEAKELETLTKLEGETLPPIIKVLVDNAHQLEFI